MPSSADVVIVVHSFSPSFTIIAYSEVLVYLVAFECLLFGILFCLIGEVIK